MIVDVTGKLAINDFMRGPACELEYYGHPHGCPKYNKGNKECPPNAPRVNEFFNLNYAHAFIVVSFNLLLQEIRMKQKHPEWSVRQCRCLRYWQQTAMKALREEVDEFLIDYPDCVVTYCPEALGVNVIVTARRAGIPVKTRPKAIVYKIAMVGWKEKPDLTQRRLIE